MILECKFALGDQAIHTGIPEAYFKVYGEKTYILTTENHRYEKYLWSRNPYLTNIPSGKINPVQATSTGLESLIYAPCRSFYLYTGKNLPAEMLQPNLYIPREPVKKRIVMCDQAGWECRRGYPHMGQLSEMLYKSGYEIVYVRDNRYPDYHGKIQIPEVTHFTWRLFNTELDTVIDLIKTADVYIGYDSGLMHLAASLKVPFVVFNSAVSPMMHAHQSRILLINARNCDNCVNQWCDKGCMKKTGNFNDKVMDAVKRCTG